jgi:hypothetical protein
MKEASMWRCSELGSHAEVLRTDMGISTGSIKNIQMLQVLSGKKKNSSGLCVAERSF